jgi:hypothetical protein
MRAAIDPRVKLAVMFNVGDFDGSLQNAMNVTKASLAFMGGGTKDLGDWLVSFFVLCTIFSSRVRYSQIHRGNAIIRLSRIPRP